MNAPTLAPNHAPHPNDHEYAVPQDPWYDADPYQRTAQPHHVRAVTPSPDETVFNEIIQNGYYGPPVPESHDDHSVARTPHPQSAPNVPAPTQELNVGPTNDELERRRRASLQASFALAHTLRTANPELMKELHAATSDAPTLVAHAAPYRGRHRQVAYRPKVRYY